MTHYKPLEDHKISRHPVRDLEIASGTRLGTRFSYRGVKQLTSNPQQYLASTIVDPSILRCGTAEKIRFALAMETLRLQPKNHELPITKFPLSSQFGPQNEAKQRQTADVKQERAEMSRDAPKKENGV